MKTKIIILQSIALVMFTFFSFKSYISPAALGGNLADDIAQVQTDLESIPMHCPASVKVIDATGNTLRNNLVTKLKLNTSSTHYAAYSFVDILNMLSENSSPTNPNTMLVFYPTWNSNPGSGKDSVGVVCKAAYFDNNQKKLIFANPDYQATWCPDMCPH